ncbi:hypothetical protein K431DRAFT_288466, partial [Polychaeton citri CBS 116435]
MSRRPPSFDNAFEDPELPSYEDSQSVHPPSYSVVRVPIKASDLEKPSPSGAEAAIQRNPITTTKTGLRGKYARSRPENDFRIVEMRKSDYELYWQKGPDGEYLPSIIEPPQGRREWLRKQLEMNEAWRRNVRAGDRDPPVLYGNKRERVISGATHAAALTACVATGPLAVGAIWGWDRIKQRRSGQKTDSRM